LNKKKHIMKRILVSISTVVILGLAAMHLESCKEEEPNFLRIVSVTTDTGLDLSGSDAIDVPLNASIIVLFDQAVSAPSVDPGSIGLMSGDVTIPSTLSVQEATITIKPTSNMAAGTEYKVAIVTNLKATDGASAATDEIDFTTFGRLNVTPPQFDNQLSYFHFNGSMNDEVGTHTPVVADIKDLTYSTDRFGYAGLAGNFNGSTTLVEIPAGELYMTNNFTLSVWIKANSTKNGQFILGLAGWKGFYLDITPDWSWIKLTAQFKQVNNTSDSEDNLFAGTGETRDNGGWQGTTFQIDVLPHGGGVGTTYFKNKWAHVVCTFDAATKLSTMYLNGEKVNQLDFDLWPMGDPKTTISGLKFAGNLTGGGNKLALGFIQGSSNRIIAETWANPADIYSNHFMGQMDDVRIFKAALTAEEVATLHAAEKPKETIPRPPLL
jgi:hypothetical protein